MASRPSVTESERGREGGRGGRGGGWERELYISVHLVCVCVSVCVCLCTCTHHTITGANDGGVAKLWALGLSNYVAQPLGPGMVMAAPGRIVGARADSGRTG